MTQATLHSTLARQVAEDVICDCCRDHVSTGIASEVAKRLHLHAHPIKQDAPKPQNDPFFENLFMALGPYETDLKRRIMLIWEEEEKQLITNIKKYRKAIINRKGAVDDIMYPQQKFQDKIVDEATEFFIETLDAEGQRVINHHSYDIGFSSRNSDEVMKWLESYVPKFSQELEKVNADILRKELAEGIAAGEGIPELTKRVNNTYDRWYRFRSEMIARSEAIRASNRASKAVYLQAGVEQMMWITHVGPRTCQWCIELDGKVVRTNQPFFNQGDEFSVEIEGAQRTLRLDYETVETPPLHPMCRCAVGPYYGD